MADIERIDTNRSANVGLSVGAGLRATARRVIQNIDYLQSQHFLAGVPADNMDLGERLCVSFSGDGDAYFVADSTVKFIDEEIAGDGTISYAIDDGGGFDAVADFPAEPMILAAGHILKMTAASVETYTTLSLKERRIMPIEVESSLEEVDNYTTAITIELLTEDEDGVFLFSLDFSESRNSFYLGVI